MQCIEIMVRTPSSDADLPPRVLLESSRSALLKNYQVIQNQAPGQKILPMLKANAYGHGAIQAARALAETSQAQAHSTLEGFGVATLEEGAQLREHLGALIDSLPILVFSGATPWSEACAQFCLKWRLTPVFGILEDWERFWGGGWAGRIPYELKWNTGMNRLGLPLERLSAVAAQLRKEPSQRWPRGVLSHLACSEQPAHPLSLLQWERFKTIRSELSFLSPKSRFHLANSGAIQQAQSWKLREATDFVRPGIALYGISPSEQEEFTGLLPVLLAQARVLQIRHLSAGERIGYQGSFQVAGKTLRVADLAAGYADGLPRKWGNEAVLPPLQEEERGENQAAAPQPGAFLGIISMDLSTIAAPEALQSGDWVKLWSTSSQLWRLARKAGTIPYEILTSLGSRAERRWV